MSTVTSNTSSAALTQTSFKAFVSHHKLITFFALAIAFAWIAVVPALFFGADFQPYQTLGAYGPLLAALVVSAVSDGSDGIKILLRRMTHWRFGLGWYLLAIFGLMFLYLTAVVLAGALSIQTLMGKWSLIFTFYIPALFTTYLVNPIGEETGWTGFALPHLQKRFSPWLSAVILGVMWAIWHLPSYFIPSATSGFDHFGFFMFTLIAVFTRVMWTWVTNNAKGSGISGVLLHASSNAVSVGLLALLLPPVPANTADDMSGPILLGLLLLSAVLILIFTRGKLSYKNNVTEM